MLTVRGAVREVMDKLSGNNGGHEGCKEKGYILQDSNKH